MLVYDIYVSNMKNTLVQERLFTEPKNSPVKALKFAFAFEQGAKQTKAICVKTTPNIKEEPVSAVEKNNECYKCGEKPPILVHQKVCKATNAQCRNCRKTRYYARMCRRRKPETKPNKTVSSRIVNVVHQKIAWSSSQEESIEEVQVQHRQ